MPWRLVISFDCTGSGRALIATSTTASSASQVFLESLSISCSPLRSGRAEAASASCRFVECLDFAEPCLRHRRNDHLRDARAPLDGEGVLSEIGEDALPLAAIVAIDRAGRIQNGNAVLRREPGARAHLRLEAVLQRAETVKRRVWEGCRIRWLP